jgi:N-acyl-D-aspartate/D-glutamate deacylase
MGGSWQGVMIVQVQSEAGRRYLGRRVPEVAEARGSSDLDAVCDLLIAERGAVQIVNFAMAEVDVAAAARTPWLMLGTDGSAIAPRAAEARLVHPRAYGSTARFLHDHAGQDGGPTWEAAIERMTALPARRLGLADRGRVAGGLWADLVVLDPARVEDLATYERPHVPPAGVVHVLVNGRLALRDGRETGERAGRVLRKGRA